jgi:hypothetical protein
MNKRLSIPFFLAVLLSSCSHYYYVSNVQNVPLFKEKDEYRFSGMYGEGDESSSLEVQAAYSVTDKIGMTASFMSAKGGDISNKNYGKGSYFEGAIGYYKPVKSFGVFEIYGGMGGGDEHHEYSNNYDKQYIGSSELSLFKFFIQPSFGLTYNAFDIALSTRLSRLSFMGVHNNLNRDSAFNDELNALSDKSHCFIEPAITLRGGWKNVKVQFQAAYTGYLNNPGLNFAEETHFSIGLYVTLAKRYRNTIPAGSNL